MVFDFSRMTLSQRIGAQTGPREPTGCRLWLGGTRAGYGAIEVDGHLTTVGRALLGLKRGDPRVAMHSCDVRLCCEPSHLSIGSVRDNAIDSVNKRRHPAQRPDARVGDRNPRARITLVQAQRIAQRARCGEMQTEIAASEGVNVDCVNNIATGKTWKRALELAALEGT